MTNPTTTFTNTPPNMMMRRCHAGLDLNSQGCAGCANCSLSIDSSTIPEIFTKPPSGNQPIPHSVSPIFFLNRENQGLKKR